MRHMDFGYDGMFTELVEMLEEARLRSKTDMSEKLMLKLEVYTGVLQMCFNMHRMFVVKAQCFSMICSQCRFKRPFSAYVFFSSKHQLSI